MRLERWKARDESLERDSMTMGEAALIRFAHDAQPRWSSPLNNPFAKLALVAGLLVGSSAFAVAGPNELQTVVPRPPRSVNEARLERVDDAFGDAVEQLKESHAKLLAQPQNSGKKAIEIDPVLAATTLERATDKKGDERLRTIDRSARRDAHLARLLDRKGDREEIVRDREHKLHDGILVLLDHKNKQDTVEPARVDIDKDELDQQQRRDESKSNSKQDNTHERSDNQVRDRQNDNSDFRRERIDTRDDQKTERTQDAKDRTSDAKADRAQDRADRTKDVKDDKAKDRADDRKERRDEVRQEQSDDRSTKQGAGATTTSNN